jgi:hypothetical protein
VDIVQLRLTTGSDYRDDLAALRDTIRRNGTRATRHAVDLVIDDDAGAPRVSLLLNLAWQAAKNGKVVVFAVDRTRTRWQRIAEAPCVRHLPSSDRERIAIHAFDVDVPGADGTP